MTTTHTNHMLLLFKFLVNQSQDQHRGMVGLSLPFPLKTFSGRERLFAPQKRRISLYWYEKNNNTAIELAINVIWHSLNQFRISLTLSSKFGIPFLVDWVHQIYRDR